MFVANITVLFDCWGKSSTVWGCRNLALWWIEEIFFSVCWATKDQDSQLCTFFPALLFCCCVTNNNKFSSLKQYTHSFTHSSVGQQSFTAWLNPLLRVSQDWNQGIFWTEFSSGDPGKIHFQAHSCRWQNSVSCSCSIQVSVVLLTVSWGLLSASWGRPHCLPHRLSIFNGKLNPSGPLQISGFFSLWSKNPDLKGFWDKVRPTCVIGLS